MSLSAVRQSPWSLPVATTAVVATAALVINGVLPGKAFASQHPKLPARSAAQLLAAVETSNTTALSGTVTEAAHWGLPSLPGADGAASLSWQALLTGSHTVTVAVDGPTKQRLGVLGSLSEADVIHNGANLWTYTSRSNEVTHTVLTKRTEKSAAAPETALTPQGAAQQVLADLAPSTTVSVDPTQMVAGRSAYTLVLTPRDARSTLREVTIALDSEHFVPLRVQLFGAATTPAFQTGFSAMSFATPAASKFVFTPPKGSVTAASPFSSTGSDAAPLKHDTAATAKPKVLGAGWTSILEVPAGAATSATARSHDSALSQLNSLTSPVGTAGDRLLHTAVINALITRDGKIFVGAVSPEMLQEAAAGKLG